ncbi:WD40 repeat domain-containing protein [Algoriphagus halophytocola]|uniref:WD40 repeat domain-containing protein n=1 Tax=Algoriphagus halophytocola TaxID=2991499 RepID=A0ABY6MG66_9BACT|nr:MULTISPECIES: WD40 repeat domain-containing protein [unclassified Algoriphagus]UZD22805.1 WD40 repeat domain-containing protein [Algoriphagus sp. TR-M5]WBL44070.1 WD40 repeat domain-containing protein [Algoriphagus sp. TR-M9]
MSKIEVNKLQTLTGHNDCIYALAEGCDPRFFYTGAGDGMVVEWDLDNPANGKLIARLPHSVYALAVDPVRNLIFVGHNFEGIHVIDLTSSKELWSLKMTNQAIFDIQVFGDEAYVGAGDGVLTVINIPTKSIKKHIKLSSKSIRVMSLARGKRQLALGLSDHSIKILDLSRDFHPVTNLNSHQNSVFALAYAPDEKTLISGSRDATLKFWSSEDYSLAETVVAHMYAINYLSFNEEGAYFVTCSMDKSIKIWETNTRKLLKVIDKARNAGHGTSVNKVLWSSYNGSVISISDDRSISIWKIEAN